MTAPALSSATPLDDEAALPDSLSSSLDLLVAYEVELTCSQILKGAFKRIALQFPDPLLHDAVPVYQAIRAALPLDIEVYVLADTTFGSCCVDEVAAEHVNADLVVHYGHACMSPTVRLPVIYVFAKKAIDAAHAASELARILASEELRARKAALLLYDVAYEWRASDVKAELQKLVDLPILLSTIDRSAALDKGKAVEAIASAPVASNGSCCAEGNAAACGCAPALPPSAARPSTNGDHAERSGPRRSLPPDLDVMDAVILYIGEESLGLTNLLMTHPATPIISYSPQARTARLESGRTNRMLMRRYAVTQKAKDADVFGIVVGTLGVASYLPLIAHLRALLRKHHKKGYTLAVGKLNPAKLANYLEVECFVLVACGENSLVEGAKDFLRPIVTPFELEVALGERPWTGSDYVLDFGQLLASPARSDASHQSSEDATDDSQDGGDRPVFSSVTGKYRTPKRFGDTVLDPELGALSLREGSRAVAEALGSAAGMHLADRSYLGLDPRYGRDAPAAVEQGRTGVARGYGDDRREGS